MHIPGSRLLSPAVKPDCVSSLHSVVPLVQMGETDANVAKFLNRCLSGMWWVCLNHRACWWVTALQ